MAVSPEFVDYVLEQLQPLGGITHRRMFGGVGLSRHDLFFALIADDTLYLKVDDANRADFEAAGCEPFKPFGGDKAMSYWCAPLEALEDPDLLAAWAGKAIEAAVRAKTKPRTRRKP
ncbi:TfoX/Sxy family protein [Phenylobacterium sp.]|uniref:TfoX/Sxy family protein n=1 Tax=Phenylobacterium sp. TaxID=1871053 RepID=UPI002721D540|nr:TfoX/Sxy family protein [Phenylobacterium sp.]MDO8381342.1 TfoX/Sxy family protein [Phenylobacterium sp.]